MRLFIAIDLPDAIRDPLTRLCRGIEAARWVKPGQMHLTLRFIGEQTQEALEGIKAALARVEFEPITLSLCSVGVFPPGKPRNAKVLWAGVEPKEPLQAVKARIDQALQAAGVPSDEERTFAPHITLARFKQPPDRDLNAWLQANQSLTSMSWKADQLTLFASELNPDGAMHRALASIRARPVAP